MTDLKAMMMRAAVRGVLKMAMEDDPDDRRIEAFSNLAVNIDPKTIVMQGVGPEIFSKVLALCEANPGLSCAMTARDSAGDEHCFIVV